MTGEPGHWQEDHWVLDKHPFELGVDNRCTECGQPESNASHPPLPEEEPVRESLDEQMSRAIGNMRRLSGEVVLVDRKDWTREQWVAEAEEIMDDIDGSVMSLLNGHINALFEELHDLRNRNLSMKAIRTVDLRTILRLTPVVDAAQEFVTARRAFIREGESVELVKWIATTTGQLETAVNAYAAILEAEDLKEKEQQGEKNG